MASITGRHLADAALRVQRMTLQDRERLADDVHARQPNLLFSVLSLQRHGATLEQLEVVLNLLLVFHEAMKGSGLSWPLITEQVQERCLARVAGSVRFVEGLAPQLQTRAVSDAVGAHPERELLAYVFATFEANGLLGIRTDAEKFLMLAALNLVECISETSPARPG